MTDYQYYLKGKSLLLRILKQRRWLVNHQKSQLPITFTIHELKKIDYAVGSIKNGKQMKNYLIAKSETLSILISAVNRKYKDELKILTKTII